MGQIAYALLKVFPIVPLLTFTSDLFLEVSARQARGLGARMNCGSAGDIEIRFERTQHLLAHPRVLSTKERTPKVRSSLPIIDRWKPRRTLIISPVPNQGYALLTPTPYRDTCYTAAKIVYQGCWAAIVVLHRSLAFRARLRSLARTTTTTRRLQELGFSHLHHTATRGMLPRCRTPRVLQLILLVFVDLGISRVRVRFVRRRLD